MERGFKKVNQFLCRVRTELRRNEIIDIESYIRKYKISASEIVRILMNAGLYGKVCEHNKRLECLEATEKI